MNMQAKTLDDAPPPAGENRQTGKEVIERLAQSAISQERLPMLDIVFDRASRTLAESFLHLMSTDVRVHFDGTEYTRFGDALAKGPENAVIAVARAEEWENSFLIVIDAGLVFMLSEILLGAAPEAVAARAQKRRPTNIELQVARRIFAMIAQRLTEAMETISKVTFSIERLETNSQFAALTRSTSSAVKGVMSCTVAGVTGQTHIIFPTATLDPAKESLQQIFVGERFGKDDAWENHFRDAVANTMLDFEAILHQQDATLKEISSWRPGDVIEFNASAETQVRLVANGMAFFQGPMGRKNGFIATQIEHAFFEDDPDDRVTEGK